ncbi:MAG TPA: nucleoside/nucleotide kinase family protein [Jatrophihabitantaceae bacterium]|nr:nucleoside/nucleotide kinase family protein [Jatrophihabitantaceae bacterium]
MAAVELSVADAVVRARRLAERGPRTLLGITGPPGAGKSTLASTLAAELGERAVVIGMDGFHLAQAELVRLRRTDRKGAPDTFDDGGYVALLRRLRSGTEPVVYAPLFRRDLEEPIAAAVAVVSSVPLVITEGNYLLLWPDVADLLDEVWYLDLPDEERRRRLTARRMSFGVPDAEAQRWTDGSDEDNARVVAATKSRADVIVDVPR